jgi:hypothetical protein
VIHLDHLNSGLTASNGQLVRMGPEQREPEAEKTVFTPGYSRILLDTPGQSGFSNCERE